MIIRATICAPAGNRMGHLHNARRSDLSIKIHSGLMAFVAGTIAFTGALWSHIALADTFPVFEALLYRNKPDLAKLGVAPVNIAYGSDLWGEAESRQEIPRQDRIDKIVREGASGGRLIIDIEHWPLRGDRVIVTESIQKYVATLQRFRAAAPSWKIGFYGMVPQRSYWQALAPENSNRYRRWQRENDTAREIADHADILFPSLYTFYADQRGWVLYATANLREARRIAPQKPIYCFLWPQFHDSTRLAYEFIPVEYWREELQTCRRLADGIVLWGGVGENRQMNRYLEWDNDAPWWRATMQFIQSGR